MTPEEVYNLVQELRAADYNKTGQSFFDERVERLKAAGWVLGLDFYRHKVCVGRRGNRLKYPHYEWRNCAYFYNTALKLKVFYWDNPAHSKQMAQNMALPYLAPKLPSGQFFLDLNRPTTHATVPIGEYTVPLIGVPPSATTEKCSRCHESRHLSEISLDEKGHPVCATCTGAGDK